MPKVNVVQFRSVVVRIPFSLVWIHLNVHDRIAKGRKGKMNYLILRKGVCVLKKTKSLMKELKRQLLLLGWILNELFSFFDVWWGNVNGWKKNELVTDAFNSFLSYRTLPDWFNYFLLFSKIFFRKRSSNFASIFFTLSLFSIAISQYFDVKHISGE